MYRFSIYNLPITRKKDGSPMLEQVRTINRTETLRRLLQDKGLLLPNGLIHDELASMGLKLSDSTINKAKKAMASA